MKTKYFAILFSLFLFLSACSTEEFDACDFDEDGTVEAFEEKRCSYEEDSVEENVEGEEEIVEEDVSENPSVERDFAPIYVSIYTHVEEPGKTSPNYVKDEEAFWEMHDAALTFAEMLHEEGVAYNFQSDWNFLEAMALYDSEGTAETNNKNLLQYLSEDLDVGIDPHAHETTHTYADVAYLIAQLGVEPSGVVGGYIVSPAKDSKVEYLQEPIQGNFYDYTWEAEILWGGGVSLHQDEEPLWASGVWRPKSNTEFLIDDPENIPTVGKYNPSWEGLDALLEKQKSGELDPDKIYTVTIPGKQTDILTKGYSEEFRTQLQQYTEETEEGRIIWIEISDVIDVWEEEYNSEPNIYKYLS